MDKHCQEKHDGEGTYPVVDHEAAEAAAKAKKGKKDAAKKGKKDAAKAAADSKPAAKRKNGKTTDSQPKTKKIRSRKPKDPSGSREQSLQVPVTEAIQSSEALAQVATNTAEV